MKHSGTILIVDDEEVIRETLEGLLLVQGHQLAFASNGTEALAKAAEVRPDLILLDVMMPDMTGFEVCQQVRADPRLAEVPIIMVTALDDRESRLHGIKVGADDFITKPFDSVELQARVQTITRLNRYRQLLIERNKFKWVVEQDEDGYLMLGQNNEMLYINRQARLYLGLSTDDPDEGISESFLELSRQRYHCEPQAAWTSWPDSSEVESPRYLVMPETSTTKGFWLQVDLITMSDTSTERYLVRLRDITGNVMAQKLKWSFHAQVSHKLKTPLTIFSGFLQILRQDGHMLTDAEKNTMLQSIDQSAMRLEEEITSIFKYLEALDTARLSLSYCRLAEIPQAVADIDANLGLESINFSIENVANPDEIYLPASSQIMELVFWELLVNAKKFHPEQTPKVEITIASTAAGIRIQVADDGLTLSPEQLVKMWIPYYQAEKDFSGQLPGMGLGLSTVASIIWSVGGTCHSFNRREGPGIVVELTLPVYKNDDDHENFIYLADSQLAHH